MKRMMGEEETSFTFEEALVYLKRIESLLETMAENVEENLAISRQLLASSAGETDRPTVDVLGDTRSADLALTIREVTIDPARHTVTLRDQPVELTRTEFHILLCLMRSSGHVISCRKLVGEIQGYELDERDARYLLRPHITRLRQKLMAEPGAPEYIHNVRGVGYFFERRTKPRD